MTINASHSDHCAVRRFGGGPCDCDLEIKEINCTPGSIQEVKACCKCEAYRDILAAQSVQMAAIKKELAQALTFFEAAHTCIKNTEKIKP